MEDLLAPIWLLYILPVPVLVLVALLPRIVFRATWRGRSKIPSFTCGGPGGGGRDIAGGCRGNLVPVHACTARGFESRPLRRSSAVERRTVNRAANSRRNSTLVTCRSLSTWESAARTILSLWGVFGDLGFQTFLSQQSQSRSVVGLADPGRKLVIVSITLLRSGAPKPPSPAALPETQGCFRLDPHRRRHDNRLAAAVSQHRRHLSDATLCRLLY